MKTTHIILAAVLAATSAIQAASAEHKLPAPLPEFKTPEQLTVWRQEMAEKAKAADALADKQANSALPNSRSTLTEGASAFYTGKPYVEESGSYAFKFRQYDPELSRWTSADPSGFPDGANQWTYIANHVGMGFDPDGLAFLHFNGSSITVWSGSGYQSGGSIAWGTAGSSWVATSGGTAGAPPVPDGWYKTSGPLALGGIDPDHYPEKSLPEGDVLFAGTMSSWDRMSGTGYGGYDASWATNRFGYNTKSGGTAPTVVEYKIGLDGIHGNTVGFGAGYRIHPTMADSTTGCVGITNYADAGSFQTYISSHIGIELLVE